MKILVINGVNMNFLGIRNREVYGNKDYKYLIQMIEEKARELKVDVECFPEAFTHTSVAIRDALESLGCIKIEVHISNISEREEFRHRSLTQPVCSGQIAGLGLDGYTLAMEYIVKNACRQ